MLTVQILFAAGELLLQELVGWFYCTRYANKLLTLDLGNVFNVHLQLLMHLMALYLWSHSF